MYGTKHIAVGSKAHKLINAYNAVIAVCKMSPWAGGLQGELLQAHDILYKIFMQRASDCGWTEKEALTFCNQHVEA